MGDEGPTGPAEKGEGMGKIFRTSVVLGVVCVLMAIGPAALAAGKPETFTEHERDFTDTFVDVICIDGVEQDAEISIVESGVFHGTFGPDGTLHVTGTFVGRFVAEPLDASLPTYTGRYTVWFGENQNANVDNTTFTFAATGTGSDGSKVNFGGVDHLTAGSIAWDEDTGEPILSDLRSEVHAWRCK